jgi:hypothetical protein
MGEGEDGPRELLKLEMAKGKFPTCSYCGVPDICATEAEDLLFENVQVRSL